MLVQIKFFNQSRNTHTHTEAYLGAIPTLDREQHLIQEEMPSNNGNCSSLWISLIKTIIAFVLEIKVKCQIKKKIR